MKTKLDQVLDKIRERNRKDILKFRQEWLAREVAIFKAEQEFWRNHENGS
jgi:hypothetical protein